MDKKLIIIGEVVRAQGIKGRLKVRPFADPDVFEAVEGVCLKKGEDAPVYYTVTSSQLHKGAVLLSLEGVETMTRAEELIGSRVFAETDLLEKLPEGEYYWFQVIGLDAYTDDGRYLGKVEDIFPTGSNDVYVVRDGEKEYLIPAIEDVISKIDIAAGRMIITPIKGLLGEE